MDEELKPQTGEWENPQTSTAEPPEEFKILGSLPISIWDKL